MAFRGIMEFTAGQTLRIILALIFIVGAGTMFASFVSVNDNENMHNIICKVFPNSKACSDVNTPAASDYKAAKMSTEALVCAVNSVATDGEQQYGKIGDTPCANYYKNQETQTTQITNTNQLTPEQMVNDYFTEQVYIGKSGSRTDDDCNTLCRSQKEHDEVCGDIPGCLAYSGRYIERELVGVDWIKRDKCQCVRLVPMAPYVSCAQESDGYACTVSNFNLPQTVTKKEEWIPYYGDPKYIVYWQKFPISEDTWTFKTAWWMYGLIIAASALPMGKMGAVVGKAGLTEAEAAARAGLKNMIKSESVLNFEKMAARDAIKQAEVTARKDIAEALKRDLKSKLFASLGKSSEVFKQGGKLAAGLGVMATLSVADVLDSWMGKLVPYDNKILLKQAGKKEPEQFSMQKDMPVIMRYKSGLLGKSTPTLVLASPCYLSSMTVKKSNEVVCGYFVSEDGDITCNEPEVKNDRYPLCNEPDSYLRTHGGKLGEDTAKDPIVQEVMEFKKGNFPEFMQVGNNRATVLLSDGVYAVFDTRPGHTLDNAYVIFDTDSSPVKIKILKSTGNENPNVLIGEATYHNAKIFLRFYDFDKECVITAEGNESLKSYNPDNVDGSRNFAFMSGVGCLGYAGVSERCDKSERGNSVCKLIEGMNDRAIRSSDMMGSSSTVYTQFRYGGNWSISALGSGIDKGGSSGNAGYWIELTDTNGDYYPDKIGISNGIVDYEFGNTIKQVLEFMDTGTGQEFETYTMTDCRLPDAVLITDFDKRAVNGDNYCYAQPTGGSIALNIGGQVVAVAGTIAAAYLTGGAAIALMSGTGAVGGGMQAASEIKNKWPNAGGR